jgi:hypothetical protein
MNTENMDKIDWKVPGNDRRVKLLIAGVAAAFTLFACLGTLVLSLAFSGGRQVVYLPGPSGAQITPDDGPRAQTPNGVWDPRGANGFAYGRGGRSSGFGPLAFIGGVFRFFFTLALIVFLFALARRIFFGRSMCWAGGPGAWRGDAPPWVDDWHRKLHERMDAQQRAPAAAAQASDAPAPADAPDIADRKPEDGPVI